MITLSLSPKIFSKDCGLCGKKHMLKSMKKKNKRKEEKE
jgi:N-dimethylarginine dimethylaminohydrolase